jgi:tRNA-dihydrouridine synthase C
MDVAAVTLALAPMQGITDARMRAQLTLLGGIDYCVTEFIRVGGRTVSDTVFERWWPEVSCGGRTTHGTPVHAQLLGSDPGRMTHAARRLVELGVKVIDLNFGCPVRRVNGHDGGAALLRDPGRLQRLIAAVRAVVPSNVELSAKVRLGWNNPDDIVELAQAVEAAGTSFLTIHGRTRTQGYSESADWERIGKARARVSIPVVANGDIRSPQDLARCREITGCDRFLIGRGAIERPELFRVLRGIEPGFWSWQRRLTFVLGLVEQRVTSGERPLNALGRLKGWCQLMARSEPALTELFEVLKWSATLEHAMATLRRLVPEIATSPRPCLDSEL